jgi:AcrR family transcriptional regulator
MARPTTRVSAPGRAGRKAPAQARSRATVDVILEATARVLARRGYAGANTNLIAETAGVSIGSIYQYFPNKAALVSALQDRHEAEMHALVRGIVQSEPTGRIDGVVAALVRALMAAHREQAALMAVLEGEFKFHDTARDDVATEQKIIRLLRDWLRRHRSAITVKNLDLAAHVVFDTLVSLVHRAILEPPPRARPAELEAEITALVMGYLTVKRRPARPAARARRAAA